MRIVFLIFIGVFSAALCSAEILRYEGEGTLFEDTVWEGDVLVDGILTVASGVTLEIRPGTRIRFTRSDNNTDGIGEHEIFVQGRLRAEGTADEPVLFTSAETSPAPGDWGAVNMMASEEGNRLAYCIFEYAYRGFHAHFSRAELMDDRFRHNVRGIQFQESTVDMRGCRIHDNINGMQFRNSTVTMTDTIVADNYWGIRGVYSDLAMNGCRVSDNLVNGVSLREGTLDIGTTLVEGNRKGLYLQESRSTVHESAFVGNSEYGILLEKSSGEVVENRIADNGRGGVKWVDSEVIFKRNLLLPNGEYVLVNDGAAFVDASGNCWETPPNDGIDKLVRDGRDRSGLGFLDVSDPLESLCPSPLLP